MENMLNYSSVYCDTEETALEDFDIDTYVLQICIHIHKYTCISTYMYRIVFNELAASLSLYARCSKCLVVPTSMQISIKVALKKIIFHTEADLYG